ncbi:hypothetical protein RFI_09031, partial [Reticulomyxa filosa]
FFFFFFLAECVYFDEKLECCNRKNVDIKKHVQIQNRSINNEMKELATNEPFSSVNPIVSKGDDLAYLKQNLHQILPSTNELVPSNQFTFADIVPKSDAINPIVNGNHGVLTNLPKQTNGNGWNEVNYFKHNCNNAIVSQSNANSSNQSSIIKSDGYIDLDNICSTSSIHNKEIFFESDALFQSKQHEHAADKLLLDNLSSSQWTGCLSERWEKKNIFKNLYPKKNKTGSTSPMSCKPSNDKPHLNNREVIEMRITKDDEMIETQPDICSSSPVFQLNLDLPQAVDDLQFIDPDYTEDIFGPSQYTFGSSFFTFVCFLFHCVEFLFVFLSLGKKLSFLGKPILFYLLLDFFFLVIAFSVFVLIVVWFFFYKRLDELYSGFVYNLMKFVPLRFLLQTAIFVFVFFKNFFVFSFIFSLLVSISKFYHFRTFCNYFSGYNRPRTSYKFKNMFVDTAEINILRMLISIKNGSYFFELEKSIYHFIQNQRMITIIFSYLLQLLHAAAICPFILHTMLKHY